MSSEDKPQDSLEGLYLYGSGEMDQLSPLKEDNEENEINETKNPLKIPIHFIEISEKIKKIQCGQMFTMILSNYGNVYTFGCADNGGLGHEESIPAKKVNINFKAIGISGGDCHGLCYNKKNLAFWGQFRNSQGPMGEAIINPKILNERNFNFENLKKVVSGTNHVIILTDEGNIYSFGNKEYGQLGIKNINDNDYNELKIYKINENNVLDIFSGDEHSFLIKNENDEKILKGWGLNNKGQIGIGTYATEDNMNANVFFPTKINIPNNLIVKKCVGGNGISACITENNKIFCWGYNEDNLLGMDCDDIIIPEPKEFEFFNRENVDDIFATYLYFYAINYEKNNVYSWGMGESYVLGNKKEKQEKKPYLIKSAFYKNLKVTDISLGCSHVAVVLKQDSKILENINNNKEEIISKKEINVVEFGVQKRRNDRLFEEENNEIGNENIGGLKGICVKEEFITLNVEDKPKVKKVRYTY